MKVEADIKYYLRKIIQTFILLFLMEYFYLQQIINLEFLILKASYELWFIFISLWILTGKYSKMKDHKNLPPLSVESFYIQKILNALSSSFFRDIMTEWRCKISRFFNGPKTKNKKRSETAASKKKLASKQHYKKRCLKTFRLAWTYLCTCKMYNICRKPNVFEQCNVFHGVCMENFCWSHVR